MAFATVPTEYMGVVFRSKSEAMFARALDLTDNGFKWVYEPNASGANHPHNWDFEILDSRYRRGGPRRLLIEYKPSMPTMTYADNLVEKIRPVADPRRSHNIDSYIVWGSPFNPAITRHKTIYVCYPIFTHFGKFGWGEYVPRADHGEDEPWSTRHDIVELFGITNAIAKAAMDYRFDLARPW